MNPALLVNDKDNVATVFAENIKAGAVLSVMDKTGGARMIKAATDVPYGHKVAVCPIKSGEIIYKYGETIGRAVSDIEAGAHVHIHNLESTRGRGDL